MNRQDCGIGSTTNPGFSLVELMVTVGIVIILAAVAAPMYGSYVRNARAEEGRMALALVKTRQEVFRSTNFRYASKLNELSGFASEISDYGNYYKVEITAASNTTYRARAWDGQKAIGGLDPGYDEWVLTQDMDDPCRTKNGTGEEADPCAASLSSGEGDSTEAEEEP